MSESQGNGELIEVGTPENTWLFSGNRIQVNLKNILTSDRPDATSRKTLVIKKLTLCFSGPKVSCDCFIHMTKPSFSPASITATFLFILNISESSCNFFLKKVLPHLWFICWASESELQLKTVFVTNIEIYYKLISVSIYFFCIVIIFKTKRLNWFDHFRKQKVWFMCASVDISTGMFEDFSTFS